MRQANGSVEPHHVRYWSIGNENYGAWEMGDVLLLCSDGLHGALAEDDILQILSQNGLALDEKCQWIVEAALRRDATDNVTAVLAQNDGEGGGL